MGIYLPNVYMPKDDKALTIQICPDGSIWQQYRGTVPNAKAVHVPPHGRLGDLDELYNHLNEWYLTHEHGFLGNEKIYIRAMLSGVKDSPTIIEAEG